jgi:OOP family OmpA-OmpF porin
MTKFASTLTLLCIGLLGTAATLPANAAPASEDVTGAYIGGALGRSNFNAHDLGVPRIGSDEHDTAGKIYGGYRFNEHFGVEGGYARLGSFSERVTLGNGSTVEQTGRGRSFYVAGTGRYALSQQFALTGRLGVSAGRISGTSVMPAGTKVIGAAGALMMGVGAEFQLAQKVALTLDYDHFGRLSAKISGNLISAGVRFNF